MTTAPVTWYTVKPWSRHSIILITAGLVYIFSGIIRLLTYKDVSVNHALHYADLLMPLRYWGIPFIFTGVIAVVASRWPAWPKHLGYAVLTGWSAAWAAFYIVGYCATRTDINNLSAGLVWALIAFLWWGISGLVSPPKEGDV